LHAGVPLDLLGLGTLDPLFRCALVPGMNPGDTLGIGELKALTSRRQQVPAQGTITDAALKNQDRSVDGVANVVADAKLRADLAALDGHPLVIETPHATSAAAHHPYIPNIHAHGPVSRLIYKVRVQFLLLYRTL